MAGNDIDFEELDRAISALMESQGATDVPLDDLASANQPSEPIDNIATQDDFALNNLAESDNKNDSPETEAVLRSAETTAMPDVPAATVELKHRQSIDFDAPTRTNPTDKSEAQSTAEPRPAFTVRRFDLPDRPESAEANAEVPVKVAFDREIEQLAEAAVASFKKETPKPDTTTARPASAEQTAPVLTTKPAMKPLESPKTTPLATDEVKFTAVKKPILPTRRGKYMDFVSSDDKTAPKNLNPAELLAKKRQRAAAINRANAPQSAMSDVKPAARPISRSQSVDFAINLPAESDAPAVEVKGNYHTSHTTTQTEAGDTVTIKRETVNYVATPVEESQSLVEPSQPKPSDTTEVPHTAKQPTQKPAVSEQPAPAAEPPQTQEPVTTDDNDTTRKSPFLAEAKVKKRPLGQPEPLLSSPAVTMKVPERIKSYDTDSQTALYRAELHQNLPEEKSSKFWLVMMILIILIIAGIVYYFWGDLKALFL